MEKKNCYALFIGINNYENTQISDLNACVHDAERLLAYIQNNLDNQRYTLHTKTLFSNSPNLPTRQNIIDSIIEHLGQARGNDVVLLYYSGHGSSEKAPIYFGEADGNLQTLVPCDARMDSQNGHQIKNILDKELRYLFYNLWKDLLQKPELIFIQDSCHATGSTRYKEQIELVQKSLKDVEEIIAQENQIAIKTEIPLARYTNPTDYEISGQDWTKLDISQLAQQYSAFDNSDKPLQFLVENIKNNTTSFESSFPIAEQIHFSACDKHQYAYELKSGGIFTSKLLSILEATNNSISYQDLFNRVRISIGGLFDQTPDLYIHHSDYKKRYEVFLGGLLQHQPLQAYREVDVFNGFSLVETMGLDAWQIKSSELDLLPILGNKTSIPIEVFPFDQRPKGLSNAVITEVHPNYSKIEFTTATYHRNSQRNTLYAMIPPQYLRRWRVAVGVEEAAQKSVFVVNVERDIKKDQRNLFNKGPHVHITTTLENATYLVQETSKNYLVLNQKKEIILQLDTSIDNIKNATKKVVDFLFTAFNNLAPNQKKEGIYCYFETENAFAKFQKEQAAVIAYYDPFINWTSIENAEYIIKTKEERFAVYSKSLDIPVFQKTDSSSTKDGLNIILGLQKISKWQTVLKFNNKFQVASLAKHQFEFEFKCYHKVTERLEEKVAYDRVSILSDNNKYYTNMERGELLPLQTLYQKNIVFLNVPNQYSNAYVDIDLNISHLKGAYPVYISTLLLNSNFGVLPLQKAMGCNLLPVQESSNSSKGTLRLSHLQLPKPEQMKDAAQQIKSVTFYIKIFIAYQRFDISGLLQDNLPSYKTGQQPAVADRYRSLVQQVPATTKPGAWMAFTIPILVHS